MKKVSILAAVAMATGLASCTAQAPKATLKTDVDSLSYAIGISQTGSERLSVTAHGDGYNIHGRFPERCERRCQ